MALLHTPCRLGCHAPRDGPVFVSPPDQFSLSPDRGNSLQTPEDWIGRIRGSSLALVVADREANTWASLRRGPLASRPHSSVWLALPADWQEHPVLRHTAQELGRMGGPQQLEG
jgi:hypothetical protein